MKFLNWYDLNSVEEIRKNLFPSFIHTLIYSLNIKSISSMLITIPGPNTPVPHIQEARDKILAS